MRSFLFFSTRALRPTRPAATSASRSSSHHCLLTSMGAGRSRAADFSPDVGPDGRAAPARGGAATDAANYRVGPPPATAAAPSITVVCPSCRATLIPPAELFTCPCGLLIQLAPQSLAHGFMPPELDGPIAAHYSALLREIARRGGLGIGVHGGGGGGRPPGLSLPMPQVVRDNFDSRYLLGLITQLPSDDYGRPHPEAYAALMNKLERAIKGAPKQLIERLPTREWEPPPSSATLSEDACTCGVCLAPYERGEILRTLPCLHTCAFSFGTMRPQRASKMYSSHTPPSPSPLVLSSQFIPPALTRG